MSLLLHELTHVALSLIAGLIVWRIYKNFFITLIAAFLGGVLVDVDHLFDYFLFFGPSFNLNYFINGYHFALSEKIYVPFHGFEWVPLLITMVFLVRKKVIKALILALALGLFSHLIADTLLNKIPLKSYFFFYRVKQNFELKKLVYPEHYKKNINDKERIKNLDALLEERK